MIEKTLKELMEESERLIKIIQKLQAEIRSLKDLKLKETQTGSK